ncbi:MAG: 2OG-Fe(II) oxygenase [Woeseia sp.]
MSELAQAHHPESVVDRLDGNTWERMCQGLDADGFAMARQLMSHDECDAVARLYEDDDHFRSRVIMSRHGFGKGEYKYFRYPLPGIVKELRDATWPQLARVANRWNEAMRVEVRYPQVHADFLARCHDTGQCRPTPLMLDYAARDYNCLHQDLYGEHVFPLQIAILLSQPQTDFHGGEFVLTEQRPRMQSRVQVVPLAKGDAVVFAVHQRPVKGARGYYRVNMRHGVSRVQSGHRRTLGIIFHDAA